MATPPIQAFLDASQGDTSGLNQAPPQGSPQQQPQGGSPQGGPSQQPQQPPANNAENAGPVKAGLRSVLGAMVKNFSYGAGQAMLKAAGDETDADRSVRLANLAHMTAQTNLTQAQAELMKTSVPVTLPNGTTVHLPAKMAGDVFKQMVANQGKTDVANINKRFQVTPQGLYDTQTRDANGFPSLVPGSGAGVTISPEMTQQYPIPTEFVGKQIKLTDLAALERGQAFSNAMIQTAAGPVVVPKAGPKMGQATPVTINGQRIPSNQEAGAYWQAKYGVVQTVDADGNPMYTSRLSAPGQATSTGAVQLMKGRAGLENYKDALSRVHDNLDVMDDPEQRAIIARTMRNIGTIHDPGIISATLGSAVSSGLSPKAADLTAAMLQAREFIGANRQFAGNFNGSEALYQRMVSNAPSVQNSTELNRALIAQDLANTARIEGNMRRFQGGKNPQNQTPATPQGGGFSWGSAPVKK